MFSKKMVMVVGLIVLVTASIIILFVSSNRYPSHKPGRIALFFVAPFQELVIESIRFARDIWNNYFLLVSVAQQNAEFKKSLRSAVAKNNQWHEIEQSNIRLRNLLNFQNSINEQALAAEVIGKDPSSWFKAIIIDKGRADGVVKGLPVVIPEGIAGQVTDVSSHYSKVMLIIDRNSAVDALIERTRARGIIKGSSTGECLFKYVLRIDDVKVGDKIVASGLDGVFPKGQRIGDVSGVLRRNSGIFQEVTVTPYIDFEKLEEVLVLLNPPKHEFVNQQ
jgi:rod shape-determining protein MreC